MRLSIIIPSYNEQHIIAETLAKLKTQIDDSVEVMVVDQSHDNVMKEIVEQSGYALYVLSEGNSRSTTMNHGARLAMGDTLLFLHSDGVLPNFFLDILRAVDRVRTPWGGFRREHSPSLCVTRIADRGGKILARRYGYLLGDNALTVKKELFDAVGGYWEKPLFEDVALSEVLKKDKKRFFVDDPLVCSSRKFTTNGPWKTFCLMLILQLMYQCGVGVPTLASYYKRLRN